MSASSADTTLSPTLEGDFTVNGVFSLENGGVLHAPTLHYAMYGQPNSAADNVVFVTHALSGSARIADWWPHLFTAGGLLDGQRSSRDLCVIGINVPGSCYGSTGPNSIDPQTNRRYGVNFPLVSMRDVVALEMQVLASLGVDRLRLVIGASIGGMQALQFAVDCPQHVERVVAIGAAPLSAMGLGLNHIQRHTIQLDPAWQGGNYSPDSPPRQGLALARALAVCTYKSSDLFDHRYARKADRAGGNPWASLHEQGKGLTGERFDVAGYLDYQGQRFVDRFDANSYLALTRTMDTFDPARGYATAEEAYQRIQAEVMLVGISSDWLFTPAEIAALANCLTKAGVSCDYRELHSSHGHDAFLAEPEQLSQLLRPFLAF